MSETREGDRASLEAVLLTQDGKGPRAKREALNALLALSAVPAPVGDPMSDTTTPPPVEYRFRVTINVRKEAEQRRLVALNERLRGGDPT